MRRLRLGLLGTGIAAERLYLPAFKQLGHRIELVACANRTREKAERYAKLAGIGRVVDDAGALFALPEVEAVLISLPIQAQPEQVLAALRAGKAVLSEKPVGPNVAASRRLIAQAKRYSPPWLVGENFAFMEHVARLEALVKAKKLGDIRIVEARQLTLMDAKNPYFHSGWRTHPQFLGGFVVDAGVHVACALRRCFGMPRVGAVKTASFNPGLPPLDTVVATLEFASGALGTWTSCFSAVGSGPLLRVHGSRASAELSWNELVVVPRNGKAQHYRPQKDSFYRQFEHFADVVTCGKAPRLTPEEALADLTLLDALVGKKRGAGLT